MLSPAKLLMSYLQLVQFDIHKAYMNDKLKRESDSFIGSWIDVGAGDQPYKKHFSNCDMLESTNTRSHYSIQEQKELENTTSFWIEDGTHLPLKDNEMDGLVCFQVLSAIAQPHDFFKEAARVLKQGGKLVLTTDFLYPVWSKDDYMRHTASHLKKMAEQNGFKLVTIESFGGFCSMIYSLISRYIRSFPGIWKKKSIISKMISTLLYIIVLLLMPFISVIGYLIYLIERGIIDRYDFTFNTLIKAEKV